MSDDGRRGACVVMEMNLRVFPAGEDLRRRRHQSHERGGRRGGRPSTRGSYFTASREEFPSVPHSAADFNHDKCSGGSGNIENYRDIYQV